MSDRKIDRRTALLGAAAAAAAAAVAAAVPAAASSYTMSTGMAHILLARAQIEQLLMNEELSEAERLATKTALALLRGELVVDASPRPHVPLTGNIIEGFVADPGHPSPLRFVGDLYEPITAAELEAAVAEKTHNELQFLASVTKQCRPGALRRFLNLHVGRAVTDAEFARVVGALPS